MLTKKKRLLMPPVLLAAASLGLMAVLSGCTTSEEEAVKAGLNPGPPIRKAFATSLDITAQQIRQYAMQNGKPPQGEGVQVLYEAGIRSAPSVDPWNGEVRYTGDENGFTLSSAGPDTHWGTEDDIVISQ